MEAASPLQPDTQAGEHQKLAILRGHVGRLPKPLQPLGADVGRELPRDLVAQPHREIEVVEPRTDAPRLDLLGDFNALALSIPLRRLRAAGFVDTWRALFPLRVAAATFHDWTGRALGPRIDYILHRGPLSTVSAAIDRIEFAGGWASDHHPVHAVLRWRLG